MQTPSNYKISVIVVGGGIAGVITAYALSTRGVEVVLLEKNEKLFCEGSGNRRGIINPLLVHSDRQYLEFIQNSYFEAISFYEKIPDAFHCVGALQYPHNNKVKNLIEDIESHNTHLSGDIAKVVDIRDYLTFASGKAILFPRSGYITPPKILSHMLSKNLFTVECNCEVVSYQEYDSGVRIITQNGERNADFCVFANGFFAAKFFNLPLEAVRGEVVELPRCAVPNHNITTPICFNGYLVPLDIDHLLLGATYDHGNFESSPRIEKQQLLFSRLEKIFPGINIPHTLLPGRASFRTSTPDKSPFIGPLRNGSRIILNIGHGSRGFQTAISAGRIVAEYLLDSTQVPYPVSVERMLPEKKISWKRYPWL